MNISVIFSTLVIKTVQSEICRMDEIIRRITLLVLYFTYTFHVTFYIYAPVTIHDRASKYFSSCHYIVYTKWRCQPFLSHHID